MPIRLLQLTLGWLVVLLATGTTQARQPRFAGMLANGQRIEGNTLHDWHETKAKPRLESQALLDPGNPLRWLRNRSLRLAEAPAAYVEFHTGDRLPGTVVDTRAAHEDTWNPLPAHLVVQPALALEPPMPTTAEIRVATAFVRRIVWQRRTQQTYQPSTIFYRDGRSLPFRAIRFGGGQLNVLLSEGNRRIPLGDLAEVHLPLDDVWQNYFDDLAAMTPQGQSRLLQLETESGLIATTSLERLVPRFTGNPKDSDRWVHGIQPAWSFDLLWVPCRDIVFWRSFAPHEVPLSRLAPQSSVSRSALGGTGRAHQVNRSTLVTPLRSAGQDFGWGFGVPSRSELHFALPAGVKSLRTWAAIDQAAGNGGCLRFRLFANEPQGSPLWESPLLVGSSQVVDSGRIPLSGPTGGQNSLVLEVDPAATDRPAGADPLDIRDHADWLDPLLELDPAMVAAELQNRLPQHFPAWRDWQARWLATPGAAGGIQAEVVGLRDEREPGQAFQSALAVRGPALVLSRPLTVGLSDHWLVIAASRIAGGGPQPKLEVRIGGEGVSEHPLDEGPQNRPDFRPLAIPLTPYQRAGGARIDVEIRQLPAADAPAVQWRSIQVVDQLPTLYRVFEEQGEPVAATPEQTGSAAIVTDDRHFGTRSLRVTPGGSFRLELPEPIAIRERPAWGEHRFLRFAFRKQGGGQIAVELETAEPRTEAARYDAGAGEPAFGAARRVWKEKLGQDWIVMTRDLYADFGSINVRSIVVSCLGGEQANFDHFYLARSQQDFGLIPAAPSPEQTNEKARLEAAQPLIERTRPALVMLQFADGRRAAGILIRREGEILTAGHAVVGPQRDATVKLADGRIVQAKTLGVSRELDLGLLKITDAGQWAAAAISDRREIDADQPGIALTWAAAEQPGLQPQASVADIRRVFRSTLWTNVERPDWLPGGALLGTNGQLLGIHVRRSSFGGFVFSRLFNGDLEPHLQRMRAGEVWGAWPAGAQPDLQMATTVANDAVQITAVTADGPAARAGLKVGDIVSKIDGKPLATSDDMTALLAEKDAGSIITFDILRDGAPQPAKLMLLPRVP